MTGARDEQVRAPVAVVVGERRARREAHVGPAPRRLLGEVALPVAHVQARRLAQPGDEEVEVAVAVDVAPRRAAGERAARRRGHRRPHARRVGDVVEPRHLDRRACRRRSAGARAPRGRRPSPRSRSRRAARTTSPGRPVEVSVAVPPPGTSFSAVVNGTVTPSGPTRVSSTLLPAPASVGLRSVTRKPNLPPCGTESGPVGREARPRSATSPAARRCRRGRPRCAARRCGSASPPRAISKVCDHGDAAEVRSARVADVP